MRVTSRLAMERFTGRSSRLGPDGEVQTEDQSVQVMVGDSQEHSGSGSGSQDGDGQMLLSARLSALFNRGMQVLRCSDEFIIRHDNFLTSVVLEMSMGSTT